MDKNTSRDQAAGESINENTVKKILNSFERKFNENQKLRIKHADCPAKFESSETELYASLDELQGVATQPEFFHLLVTKKALPLLVSLISHENADISAKVIALILELTDIDDDDEQSHTEKLIESFVTENLVGLIVANLSRLDETVKDESQAINDSLTLIDNLIDMSGDKYVAKSAQDLIKWMIKKLEKNLEFNTIKLSIAELLSVLLITARENKIYLNEFNGIDALLQQVAYYRRVAPTTGDEHEFLEQVISCLCTAMLDCEENRTAFFEEEGIDLVELILREKRDAVKKSNIKISVLKLFNHVVTIDENHNSTVTKCCEHFIKLLGLRVLFPIFYNPRVVMSEKIKKRDYHKTLDEVEEHTTAIILALLKHCQDSELIQRILVKFSESGFEKLDRLLSMHEKYFKIVANLDNDQEDSEDDESHLEVVKSSARFTLRTIDYIILLTCYLSNHFEMYDPNSGETFANRFGKVLLRRPEFRHQILMETRTHLDELGDGSKEESNSLRLLMSFFENFNTNRVAPVSC